MAKVRLIGWVVALLVAARLLLGGAHAPGLDDPAAAVMWAVRVVAGVLALYLLLATVLALRVPRLAPRFVRQLVAAAISGGLLLSPVAASAASGAASAPVSAPVLRRLPDAAAPARSGQPAPQEGVQPPESSEEVVTVVAGDHLWAIAERTLAARLGRAPTDAEVVPYWSALIEKNRQRLSNPDDPNLIFAGQTFVLP